MYFNPKTCLDVLNVITDDLLKKNFQYTKPINLNKTEVTNITSLINYSLGLISELELYTNSDPAAFPYEILFLETMDEDIVKAERLGGSIKHLHSKYSADVGMINEFINKKSVHLQCFSFLSKLLILIYYGPIQYFTQLLRGFERYVCVLYRIK